MFFFDDLGHSLSIEVNGHFIFIGFGKRVILYFKFDQIRCFVILNHIKGPISDRWRVCICKVSQFTIFCNFCIWNCQKSKYSEIERQPLPFFLARRNRKKQRPPEMHFFKQKVIMDFFLESSSKQNQCWAFKPMEVFYSRFMRSFSVGSIFCSAGQFGVLRCSGRSAKTWRELLDFEAIWGCSWRFSTVRFLFLTRHVCCLVLFLNSNPHLKYIAKPTQNL